MTSIEKKQDRKLMETVVAQKVVFQLSNNDTFLQKSLIRQLNNVLKTLEGVQVEVVTHGYGVDLLLRNSSFEKYILALHEQGVRFLVCQNALDQEEELQKGLLEIIQVIPSGLAHVITRQSEGWSYVKAGF